MGVADACWQDDLLHCKELKIGTSDANYLDTINFFFEGSSYLQTDYLNFPEGENSMLGSIHGKQP